MKIRKGLLVLMLIMFAIPSITLAQENTTVVEQQNQSKDCKEKREERKKEILQMVEEYSPENLDEWKDALATRDDLLAKFENDGWRKHHKDIDKEKWKKMKQKKHETMRELKEAAKNGDEEKVDEMLSSMLTKLKEHNRKLQEKTS